MTEDPLRPGCERDWAILSLQGHPQTSWHGGLAIIRASQELQEIFPTLGLSQLCVKGTAATEANQS